MTKQPFNDVNRNQLTKDKMFRSAIITFLLASTLSNYSIACDCFGPPNFCETLYDNNPDLVVFAVKKTDQGHGMQVEILEVLKGAESRQQVMVWGDNGLVCRHYTSQWSAGDTVIFSLHLIGQLSALPQEDSADYLISVCGTYFLDYAGGQVSGAINGVDTVMSYTAFKNSLSPCVTPIVTGCNPFHVTAIQTDSAHTRLEVTVFFDGDSSVFINYPYVSLVTNHNGDTLATGTISFFGQFGGTSQTYSASTVLDSQPANFSCTIYFHYDTSVCVLSYPCTTTGFSNDYFNSVPEIFPNPSDGVILIEMEGLLMQDYPLEVYNTQGENIYAASLSSAQDKIDLTHLPPGLYFVRIFAGNKFHSRKIIIR